MHRSAHNGPRSGRVGCQAQHVGRGLRRIWFNIALFVSGKKGKCTETAQLKRSRVVRNHSASVPRHFIPLIQFIEGQRSKTLIIQKTRGETLGIMYQDIWRKKPETENDTGRVDNRRIQTILL